MLTSVRVPEEYYVFYLTAGTRDGERQDEPERVCLNHGVLEISADVVLTLIPFSLEGNVDRGRPVSTARKQQKWVK